MTTKVKICGITNLEDARHAVACGADMLGFNFYSKSKRFVSPSSARVIVANLPQTVVKVGVFVNEGIEKIVATAAETKLDAVQLHGEELPGFVDQLRLNLSLPIVKSFRVADKQVANEISSYQIDGVLLDAYSMKDRGGTGESFDWEIAKIVANIYPKTFLAGGLSPENVADAVSIVKPYAVDACSLLESGPGRKDPDKVARFIAATKRTI